MKKSLLSIALIIFLAGALTGQPTTITYQGKLLDSSGNSINQAGLVISFSIYDASSGGNMIWPDAGTVNKTVNVVHGLYSVQLGTGNGDDDVFTAAIFSGKSPWLEVKIDTVVMPRTPVSNVPFALIANEMATAGWSSPGQIGSGTPNTGTFTSLSTSGDATVSGELTAASLATGGNILMNALPGNDSASGITSKVSITANAIGFGAALYVTTNGNYEPANATDAGKMPCAALAVETGTGQKMILQQGYIRHDAWNWTVGKIIYVSTTDGILTQTFPTATGNNVQVVGYATHADRMYFSPNLILIELK